MKNHCSGKANSMAAWMHILYCLSIVLTVAKSTDFLFNRFNATSEIKCIADASIQSNAIRLTDHHTQRLLGRAYFDQAVPMKRKGSVISFSTSFVFAMVPQSRSSGGSGMCFVMTPTTALNGAIASQYLGLFNVSGDGKGYNHLFAVEFGVTQRLDVNYGNRVGIDLNGFNSSLATAAAYWDQTYGLIPIKLNSGRNIRAWIDYDGASQQLDIRIAPIGRARPHRALISRKDLNLSGVIQDYMYVGFSASTGTWSLVEDHYVLAWSFTTGGNKANDIDILHLPSFEIKISKFYKSTKFILITTICSIAFIIGLTLSTFYWLKKMDYIEFYEKWELQYWPQRFNYRKLKLATKSFTDKNLLGYGGFGLVYRGTLPSGEEIAVKCITKDFTQGMQEFMAEISSLGRLQHRNLVRLRGWGRKNKRLFIVYDYLSNGSLETNLFTPKLNLSWAQRYKILIDVAAGLLYLHEQWEKCVVHRDIKSSNILLDCDLNGRVGDFGLARLYDHSEKPQTTHVVGTLGYIAPELIHSGKASPSTDVFSFGALLLEVACGRKPVDAQGVILVQWVSDLYANGRLLDAVDQRLLGNYEKGEAEKVLVLGFVCSNPDPQGRPSMKEVLQILCNEGALPVDPLEPSAYNKHSYIDIADLSSSAATFLDFSE